MEWRILPILPTKYFWALWQITVSPMPLPQPMNWVAALGHYQMYTRCFMVKLREAVLDWKWIIACIPRCWKLIGTNPSTFGTLGACRSLPLTHRHIPCGKLYRVLANLKAHRLNSKEHSPYSSRLCFAMAQKSRGRCSDLNTHWLGKDALQWVNRTCYPRATPHSWRPSNFMVVLMVLSVHWVRSN